MRFYLPCTLVLLALTASGCAFSEPAPTELALEPLVHDRRGCPGRTRGTAVLRDAGMLERWWTQVACRTGSPPVVDFDANVVVAIQDRPGPNGCYDARIASIAPTPSGLEARVWRRVPGPGESCTMALVYPIDAVVVPRFTETLTFTWQDVPGGEAPPSR
ncbi:MAG: hypothetical protein AAF533_16020 [Acidobacteriota bacterium]